MTKIPVIDVEEARKHLGNYNLVTKVIRWLKNEKRDIHDCPFFPQRGERPCYDVCNKVFKNLTKPHKYTGKPFYCPCGSYGVKRTVRALKALLEELL